MSIAPNVITLADRKPVLNVVDYKNPLQFLETNLQKVAWNYRQIGVNVVPVFPVSKTPAAFWGDLRLNPIPDNDAELIAVLFSDTAGGDYPYGIAAITGYASGNLCVLDCENEARFHNMTDRLRAADLPIYATKSGSDKRGGHIFFRCADGELKNLEGIRRFTDPDGELYTDLELFGEPHIVVLPPSVHPKTRQPYTHEIGQNIPTYTLDTIRQVITPQARLTRNRVTTGKPYAPGLPYTLQTAQYIAHGAAGGERNQALIYAGNDLFGCLPPAEAEALLEQIAHRCQPDYIATDPRKWQDILKSVRKSTGSHKKLAGARDTQKGTVHQWQKAAAYVEHETWKGKEKAVMLAFVERSKVADDSGVFRASLRELSSAARVSVEGLKKVGGIIERLIDRQAIARANYAKSRGSASLWSFGEAVSDFYKKLHSECLQGVVGTVQLLSFHETTISDFREWRGLSDDALRLYDFLIQKEKMLTASASAAEGKERSDAAGSSPSELATVLDMPRRTIYYNLQRLVTFGMAGKVSRGLYVGIVRSDDELRDIARWRGIDGLASEKTAYIERERVWNLCIMPIVNKRAYGERRDAEAFRTVWEQHRETFEKRYKPRMSKRIKPDADAVYADAKTEPYADASPTPELPQRAAEPAQVIEPAESIETYQDAWNTAMQELCYTQADLTGENWTTVRNAIGVRAKELWSKNG